jgi:hypothetical protein
MWGAASGTSPAAISDAVIGDRQDPYGAAWDIHELYRVTSYDDLLR